MPIREAPAGTLVEFKVDTGNGAEVPPDLQGVQLRLEEDLAVTLQSDFDEIFSKGISNTEKVISDLIAASTGLKGSSQFKEFGFQTWRKTAPLAVSVSVTLRMKTDAFTDVIKPTRELCALCLPDDTNESGEGFGLSLPGPNILSIMGLVDNAAGEIKISCKIGWMHLNSVVVKKAEPVYSKKTDSNGYPIWAKVRLDINSTYTATKKMLLDMTPGA